MSELIQETPVAKKRMLSGIKPSGDLTLGSYLGAVKNWAERADQYDCFYFMADLHAIPFGRILLICAAVLWNSWRSISPAVWILRRTPCSSRVMSTSMRSWAGFWTATPCSVN